MKRVEWRSYRFAMPTVMGAVGGWELFVDAEYRGIVSVDGGVCSTRLGVKSEHGSQPLAAQALLRAAGVEP